MSLKSAIESAQAKVVEAYAAISEKGGTLPTTQDLANLPQAIADLPSGGGKCVMVKMPSQAWRNCFELEELGAEHLDVSNVGSIDMYYYFCGCKKVKVIDLSSWSINITRLERAFSDTNMCEKLILGEGCNTSGCTNFTNMFYGLGGSGSGSGVKNTDCYLDIRYLDTTNAGTTFYGALTYAYGVVSMRVGSKFVKGVNLSMTSLEHDAIVQLFNDLPSIEDSQTINLGALKLSYLSDTEKAIATDKGWTLS